MLHQSTIYHFYKNINFILRPKETYNAEIQHYKIFYTIQLISPLKIQNPQFLRYLHILVY